jgi:hypothetical protein
MGIRNLQVQLERAETLTDRRVWILVEPSWLGTITSDLEQWKALKALFSQILEALQNGRPCRAALSCSDKCMTVVELDIRYE